MNAFYVPDLAGMIYTMPGMQTELNAVINRAGEFKGMSSHYSGAGFAGMSFAHPFFVRNFPVGYTEAAIAFALINSVSLAGGYLLLDTQFITPHLASLGAIEIPRAEYHRQLRAALAREADFTPKGYCPSPSSVLSGLSTVSGGL